MKTWYVFDKYGFMGKIQARSTVDAAVLIGHKWGFARLKRREICWNTVEKPLWEMWIR